MVSQEDLSRLVAEVQAARQEAASAQSLAAQMAAQMQGMQAQRTPTDDQTEAERLKQTIDTRLITQINTFDGAEDHWSDWAFTFQAVCGLIGLDEHMQEVIEQTEEVINQVCGSSPQLEAKSKGLYYFLVARVREKHWVWRGSVPEGQA